MTTLIERILMLMMTKEKLFLGQNSLMKLSLIKLPKNPSENLFIRATNWFCECETIFMWSVVVSRFLKLQTNQAYALETLRACNSSIIFLHMNIQWRCCCCGVDEQKFIEPSMFHISSIKSFFLPRFFHFNINYRAQSDGIHLRTIMLGWNVFFLERVAVGEKREDRTSYLSICFFPFSFFTKKNFYRRLLSLFLRWCFFGKSIFSMSMLLK